MKKRILVSTIVIVVSLCLANVQAGMLDLTGGDPDTPVTSNGALFYWVDAASTGTGVIQSFVRIKKTGSEQGYNTDYRPLQYDEQSSAEFTHSLLLSDVPAVTLDGGRYLEFLLDINENTGGDSEFLSLDKLFVYTSSSPNLTGYPWDSTEAKPVYEMNAVDWIALDYSLNHGSGSGDMFAYIPVDAFANPAGPYVYLYSQFGAQGGMWASDAGFEEWAIRVPAPAGLVLGMLGLSVAGLKLRKFA